MTDPADTIDRINDIVEAEQAVRAARRAVRECPANDGMALTLLIATYDHVHDAYCRMVETAASDVLAAYDSPLARATLMRRGEL